MIADKFHALKKLETLYKAIFERYCLPEEMSMGDEYFECLCREHFGDVDMYYFLNEMPEAELNFRVSAFSFKLIDYYELCTFDAQEMALQKLLDLLKCLRLCL